MTFERRLGFFRAFRGRPFVERGGNHTLDFVHGGIEVAHDVERGVGWEIPARVKVSHRLRRPRFHLIELTDRKSRAQEVVPVQML